MKRKGLLILATTVTLSSFAAGQDGQPPVVQRPHPRAALAPDVARPAAATQARQASGNAPHQFQRVQQFRGNAPMVGPGINRSPRLRSGDMTPTPRTQPSVNPAPVTATVPEQQPAMRAGAANDRTGGRDWRNRAGDNGVTNNNWRNRTANGGQDWRDRNGSDNQASNRDGSATGNRDGRHHREWRHDWDRSHHDRDWWRNHYTRFALFGGGYYYWDAGFWYPAYGYDPFYSTYAYEAPIYGYNSLPPGEVMAAVQDELARRGYYYGAIDGTYGPLTRAALLRYQQSVGLAMTGMLDEPTLESLGID